MQKEPRSGIGSHRSDLEVCLSSLLIRAFVLILVLLPTSERAAHAGGPRWVAGSSFFGTSAKGRQIVWAKGAVTYYTDPGSLSSQITQAQADAMVAIAASVWNSVHTAGVSIQRGGALAEDVSGANVAVGAAGVTVPADIQPTATSKPVAVVYDRDGSVIDAMEGSGASSPLACENNGVLAMVDNFTPAGNIAHALILVNGLCATSPAQIATLQYQLIRAFGRVLGLDWSQANEEMFVGSQVTTSGLEGWPVLHPIERLCGAGSGGCMPNPMQLRTDDIAALNRLYPVTAENIGSFPGKTITASATLSVTGTVQFGRGQGMQGVNVVLRPLANGLPDVRYTAAAVSGAYFQGNAGSRVTGATDEQGNPLNRFGSDDPALEGYFDLSGVPLPPGVNSAEYELTLEPVDPLYTGNVSVGPYTNGQVRPSGTMPTIDLGVLRAGSVVRQNIPIGDAAEEVQSGADGDESSPAMIPASGEWSGRITGYGHSAWFQFWARGSREFTIEGQPLDESGTGTEDKAQIVIGAWNGSDAAGSQPVTGTVQPFNGRIPGLTTLPVLTIAASEVRIGFADLRGDGRPDFAYRGRLLYADSVTPARLPPAGGQIVIRGRGFRPAVSVWVNGVPATVLSVLPTIIVAQAPSSGGVTGNVLLLIEDTQTFGVTAIADGLSYDAQGDDTISIMAAPMNDVPIGVPVPFTVRVLNVGTQTPAAGVGVTFSLTQGAAALGCGKSTCSLTTAGDGTAGIPVTANSTDLAQITASLSSGSHVVAEFAGMQPPSLAALTPSLYLAMGATAEWPVQAMVLNPAAAPSPGQSVTWSVAAQGLTLAVAQSVSDAGGIATNQISAGPFSSSIGATVNVCLTGTSRCATFEVVPVHPQTAVLAAWSGTTQYIPASQSFAPVALRVTDAFGHPLAGANVVISQTFRGWTAPCPVQGRCPLPPLLAQQTTGAVSALDGSITFIPISGGGLPGRLLVNASTTGDSVLSFELEAHP
jgi:hypothetical protein